MARRRWLALTIAALSCGSPTPSPTPSARVDPTPVTTPSPWSDAWILAQGERSVDALAKQYFSQWLDRHAPGWQDRFTPLPTKDQKDLVTKLGMARKE